MANSNRVLCAHLISSIHYYGQLFPCPLRDAILLDGSVLLIHFCVVPRCRRPAFNEQAEQVKTLKAITEVFNNVRKRS